MLELKHISKTYKTTKGVKTEALKDINIRFPQTGMVFVLGKSGSGKSTLLNIIGGLDQANTGEIIIHGKSSADFKQGDYDAYRNTYVGFIFQEFHLMEDYTIEKNIALALQLQQKEATTETIEALLEKLGLGGYANRYPNELSGGQKQRVAIARALIKEPQILMADEPTGALDSTTGTEIFDTLKELSKEKLVIVVSHDSEAAQKYGDRIIEFKDGSIVSDSAPDVEVPAGHFEAIASHLPFKDSFHLGFSCLGHKKVRMVFTILLTSCALLLLALSDAVGNFNAVNAQYKASEDLQIHLVGVRHQYIDNYGNIISTGTDNPIKDTDVRDILKQHADKSFAQVYTDASQTIKLMDLGIDETSNDLYTTAVSQYKIAEMKNFDVLGYQDIIGTYPKTYDEVAISSYLADIMMKQGILDAKGKLQFPASYTDIIQNSKLPVEGKWLKVSGIVKQEDKKYASLKNVKGKHLDNAAHALYREFYRVINMQADKLFVKEGFVNSLQKEKSNTLDSMRHSIRMSTKEEDVSLSALAYPKTAITYFNGTKMVSKKQIGAREVILSPDALMQLLGKGEDFYNNAMAKKSTQELQTMLENAAKRLIGKQVELRVGEGFSSSDQLLHTKLKVVGVVLPKGDYKIDDVYRLNDNIVSRNLIDRHITNPLYVSELLTTCRGPHMKSLLQEYPIDQPLYAETVATHDVMSIKTFADFATRIFFYASIALFIFAAALMMNFIIVSISYRKKDIGILRAIGARSRDVLKIFIWEGVLLAAISYVVTMIALAGVSLLVNSFAKSEAGVLISPLILTLRQPVLMLVIVLVVTFLACLLPVSKIARQRPIDAIKK